MAEAAANRHCNAVRCCAPIARYHAAFPAPAKHSATMATLEDIVNRQRDGANFVISAAMLGLTTQAFDVLVQPWLKDGGPGFAMTKVPHRKCIDGEFFVDRITVRRIG